MNRDGPEALGGGSGLWPGATARPGRRLPRQHNPLDACGEAGLKGGGASPGKPREQRRGPMALERRR
ncbi:hypothetical protein EYF80_059883 [Liparis tanakae]|uniref:Uncharacterized protein n=1 Tax=Liparis tanakae TaxID=230148 RepID=A0A4Z2ELY2_9TELE|nr:hypothetical protein EYF80_059883 [Liparis tanakae]